MKISPDVIKAAQDAEKDTSCPASLTIAQYALESNWGKQVIGKFNFFGIKWDSKCGYPKISKLTKEFENNRWFQLKQDFIDFPNMSSAFRYHGSLLMNNH